MEFSTSSYPGNIGKHIFLISHILEILDRTIHTQSYPGNIGSYDPYISPILEILEIEVCNILHKPGNIGNLSFSTSSYPGNIGKRIFSVLVSWKYWKSQFGLGICRDVFTTFVLLWTHPAGAFFLPKTTLR